MNYVDRQALSILATTIQAELGISDIGYARVVQSFLFFYAVMYLLSGRLVDKFGTRLAETVFIVWWSVANMLTGLSRGVWSLAFFRSLLAIGEPGNYTASAKAVSEWFPPREKGIAVGMYSMGGTIGAAVAAPLIAMLALSFGWRAAFVVTGAVGLALATVWAVVYRPPVRHPLLRQSERELLAREGVLEASTEQPRALGFLALVRLRPMWLILLSRMITDPLWYFYLFWFPKYLQEERGFTLADVGRTVWVVFLAADLGCIAGGWLSGYFIRRGRSPVQARLRTMAGAALVLAAGFALPLLPGNAAPLALASLFACAHMAWMTNTTTLPIDIFPVKAVGSIQGAIGAGSSLGGFLWTGAVGYLVTNVSYRPVFLVMSFLHPLAFLVLAVLLPSAASRYKEQAA